MSSNTRKNRIRTEDTRDNLGVAPTEDKTREKHLRSFGHVYGITKQAGVRKSDVYKQPLKDKEGD